MQPLPQLCYFDLFSNFVYPTQRYEAQATIPSVNYGCGESHNSDCESKLKNIIVPGERLAASYDRT